MENGSIRTLWIVFLRFTFFEINESTNHRRVFFGTPHSEFDIPYSSVVTVRSRGVIACTGVLLSSTSVLTAGTLFMKYV